MTALVEVQDVGVEYAGRRAWAGLGPLSPPVRALEQVTMAIAEGESLAIVGESGSGKSTLARCLLGLLAPSRGRVLFRGTDLATVPAPRLRSLRRSFQPIFQDPAQSLPPHRSVRATVGEPLLIHRIGSARQRVPKVIDALARVGLGAELLDRLPHELSGGQRQRVAIARALICEPELLVADEPVSALDASVRRTILALVARLQRELGLALVLISHDLAWLDEVCQRVAVLYAGRLVELGPSRDVLGRPLHPYTANLLAATPHLPGSARLPVDAGRQAPVPSFEEAPAGGCAFAPRCPRRRQRCLDERPALDPRGTSSVACHFPLQ